MTVQPRSFDELRLAFAAMRTACDRLMAQPAATGAEERERIRITVREIIAECDGPVFDQMYAKGFRAALERVLDEISHPMLG